MERPRRGNYRITEAGREILGRFPQGVSKRELNELGDDQSSKVQPYQPSRPRMRQAVSMPEAAVEEMTPIEQVQAGIARVNGDVATELLKRLQGKEPGFFEQPVVDLLLAMGYGGVNGASFARWRDRWRHRSRRVRSQPRLRAGQALRGRQYCRQTSDPSLCWCAQWPCRQWCVLHYQPFH